jgi:hypothetical protein
MCFLLCKLKVVVNGQKLLDESTAQVMSGTAFPGSGTDFMKKFRIGKFDESAASNLEAFMASGTF